MSKQLERHEAEAVLLLRGADEKAWNTLMSYFSRRYELARDKCVITRNDIQLEQGKAQAFGDMADIEEDAEGVLDAIKNR
ncbi:MAG: hypothetical protein ACUZ8I_07740 [Candidatus Scalindua sp.]